jgi:hypothetical protein
MEMPRDKPFAMDSLLLDIQPWLSQIGIQACGITLVNGESSQKPGPNKRLTLEEDTVQVKFEKSIAIVKYSTFSFMPLITYFECIDNSCRSLYLIGNRENGTVN